MAAETRGNQFKNARIVRQFMAELIDLMIRRMSLLIMQIKKIQTEVVFQVAPEGTNLGLWLCSVMMNFFYFSFSPFS